MKNRELKSNALYDSPVKYAVSSGLRQVQDAQWALGLLPDRQFRSCLDVGCGVGDWLGQLGMSGKVTERLVGIDRSQDMVQAARHVLHPLSAVLGVRLRQADVLGQPKVAGTFDLVTLMAVQHWLYPDEADAFAWIAARLEPYGVFCMTTYHPQVNRSLVGGSDEVVLEAMEEIGVPPRFPAEFVTLGRRTRTAEEIELVLRSVFRVYEVHTRPAVTRAITAASYAGFHMATFGSYYAQLIPAKLRPRFLLAVGDAAMRRMKTLGYVNSMQVKFWVCGRAPQSQRAGQWRSVQVLKSA